MGQDLQAHDRKWLEGLPRKQGSTQVQGLGQAVGVGCFVGREGTSAKTVQATTQHELTDQLTG